MAYSKDYRQMILAKLQSGETYRALSLEFGISKTTILNWKKQPERKVRASRTYKIDLEQLAQDVMDYPDAFQRERAARFNCSDRAISKALKRLNVTRKKST